MIPFFRKIRYKLAKDNQFFKYSRYAIGEIILVVIGILIALYINNWNEQRKSKEKMNQLLVKVQNELLYNIKEANSNIEFYRRKDSLIYKVLNRNLTYDDYFSSNNLMHLGTSYSNNIILDDDYKSLIQFDGEVSKKHDVIYEYLREVYVSKKTILERDEKSMIPRFEDFQKKIKYEKDWYNNVFADIKYTDDMVSYFLTDPFYYNHIVDVQNYTLDNHFFSLLNFRNSALGTYKEISKYLNLEIDSIIVKELEDYQHYIGTYESPTETYTLEEEIDGFRMTGIRKKDSLFMHTSFVVPDSRAFFTMDNGYFGQLFFDENNKVIGLRRSKGSYRRDYKKVQSDI